MPEPKITWTFDLVGTCCYCGKSCKRQKSIVAPTREEAASKASVSIDNLCHRKCGGY